MAFHEENPVALDLEIEDCSYEEECLHSCFTVA